MDIGAQGMCANSGLRLSHVNQKQRYQIEPRLAHTWLTLCPRGEQESHFTCSALQSVGGPIRVSSLNPQYNPETPVFIGLQYYDKKE